MDIREYIETETGIPTAEVAFTKPQKLPFIAILDKEAGDGDDLSERMVFDHDLAIEFYAERVDRGSEEKIEAAFRKMCWKWGRERSWISEEKMFETVYTIKFTEKR